MQTYLDLVHQVLDTGIQKTDRTGTGTLSIFGAQCKYDLRQGFPLLTTKKVRYAAIVHELLWFLRGSTNIHDGLDAYTPIWNAWADEKGELGPIYGYQWRKWEKFVPDGAGGYRKTSIDQIQQALDLIRNQPDSRRIIVTAWNPADLDKMALPPCHSFFQLSVMGNRLDLQLYQRSADIALGVPYNIASYATLLKMFAQECGYEAGIFTHTLGDAHIYLNHIEGLERQLTRPPLPLPTLEIVPKSFWDLTAEDFHLSHYQCHPFIPFPVAV